MPHADATFRKMVASHGHEATIYSVTAGTEDSFGDPTYTYSQVTCSIIIAPIMNRDDRITEFGKENKEVRYGYVSADITIASGDDIYSDLTSKRYTVKGVTDIILRHSVVYRELLLVERPFLDTTTT